MLNPPRDPKIERFGWTFCEGDKVMQVENDYDKEVYNGDLGVVSRIDMEEGEIAVHFEDREVVYGFGELDELVLNVATFPFIAVITSTFQTAMMRSSRVMSGTPRASAFQKLRP